MRYKAILYMLGRLFLLFAGCLIVPAGISYMYDEHPTFDHFLISIAAALVLGAFLILRFKKYQNDALTVRDGFLLVTCVWFGASAIGALPFYLSSYFATFVDAFFESVAGFTTTGATVLSNIEAVPHGLLFWRSFTQWIGGMGIIVLAVAILPQLSVGGMQLMKNETPGPTFEQLKPRIKQTALSLWKVYLLLSVAQVVILRLQGMPLFDSICHMFATMGAGGFSPKNASITNYPTEIQMTIVFFMFLAGANFVLHYAVLKGNFKKMLTNDEWKFYSMMLIITALVIALNLYVQADIHILTALRVSVFQVVSITTTTGFVTADFDAWPHLSKGILFLLLFAGGCSGSTSGGLKQVRLLLLFKRARQSIRQHIFPKAVIPVKLNGRVVPEHVLHGVSSFFLIYIVIFSFCTLGILVFNFDFITATSAVAACLSNVGPGFGLVGATQTYALFPGVIKFMLCLCMIIGRLEIFTVLVLFFPATWRR